MMVTICILVGLGLVACGVIIACATKKGRKAKLVNVPPPPLPPRDNTRRPTPTLSQSQPRTSRAATTRALPSRRSSTPATANTTRNTSETGNGPRGIKPAQFPCCPFDKQRNVPGAQQLIFWNSRENCYRCSRGHRFKSNGKLL